MPKHKITQATPKFTYSLNTFISTFLTAYILVSALNLLANVTEDLTFASLSFMQKDMTGGTLFLHVLLICIVAGILTFLEYRFTEAKITAHTMLISTIVLSATLLFYTKQSENYMYLATIAVLAIVILYATKEGCFTFIKSDIKSPILWIGTGLVAVIFGYFVAGIGVLRQITYSTPNFDFGIFCNMFYNMTESGLPISTCERDQFLSHFAVHFSPIYYIYLPIYTIFPSAITLQVLQTLTIYSGIIPLVLISKNKGLSNKTTLALSTIYAAYPALGAGTFYDLHENCFLVPLLLWMFFFYEKKKYIPMAVFGVLTLCVKEDAFIYLCIFALYIFISDKNWKISLPMLTLSIFYFLIVSAVMESYGMGIMSNRYENLIYDSKDGLLGAIKTVIINPGYILSQMFSTSSDTHAKIWYTLQLLLPLGFLPFATKKISRYVLIVPILMNLLTMYPYQPNISFQYTFGIIAFLFYASVLNLSELEGFSKRYLLTFALVASVLLFIIICVPKYNSYVKRYDKNEETYKKFDYALTEVLPEDVSVAASSFFVTHIYNRNEIYEVKYHTTEEGEYKTDIEYVVLDMRYKTESDSAANFYLKNGYEEFYLDEGYVWILKKAS